MFARKVRVTVIAMSVAAVAATTITTSFGFYVSYSIYKVTEKHGALTHALHSHGDLDMMHDALRADVMAFAYTHSVHPAIDDLAAHTQVTADRLRQLRTMPLPADVAGQFEAIKTDIDQYLNEAQQILDDMRQNKLPDEDSVKAFDNLWRRLEQPLGAISYALEKQ